MDLNTLTSKNDKLKGMIKYIKEIDNDSEFVKQLVEKRKNIY